MGNLIDKMLKVVPTIMSTLECEENNSNLPMALVNTRMRTLDNSVVLIRGTTSARCLCYAFDFAIRMG